ncbi:heavy metal translocating P-type ATPase [Gynurincola endophyticus]|uniref:heavy metal translocating P-type ATPase n=1 Tax=Gynurincola endophyticus TaxID=2479004 RepID=UPI000F8D2EED|nr:heavy metal translocating P-type ATPase metal-binding domain-containing protein [Gynurincola endophyticus]
MEVAVTTCYHCGLDCVAEEIHYDDHQFCCEGCKMVYQLLNEHDLCTYYNLNDNPGKQQKIKVREDKFTFLEQDKIQQNLIHFQDETKAHVDFYLPQIHCSSCLYLLEHLHKLNDGIVSARVNFAKKEVSIVFLKEKTTLRTVAELLTSIGYEPYISLNQLQQQPANYQKGLIYKLGVAGFCFSNIMLMSFPEYLGLEDSEQNLQNVFRTIIFVLAIPVFFYSAQPFFISGWKALTKRFLNIDAPIALAVLVTYARSVYEVLSGTGAGYFDSMSGIVFFMLAGRVVQQRTYDQLTFDRDFTSYFPIAVEVIKKNLTVPTALPDIKVGDTLLIHNEELIPCDGMLVKGRGHIDYSFVTGESAPVTKEMGELVYAGGKQVGGNVEMLVMREVTQSYLTRLWTNDDSAADEIKGLSFLHGISKWFTVVVFAIAILGAAYWAWADPSKILNVVTAVLIVACPCALLLVGSFTNGNILRILGRNKFYLRNAQAIEEIEKVNHIVFDKTGTLTTSIKQKVEWEGAMLSWEDESMICSLAIQSTHPMSRAIAKHFIKFDKMNVTGVVEIPGKGVSGYIDGNYVQLGSRQWIQTSELDNKKALSEVLVAINHKYIGRFIISNQFREGLSPTLSFLKKNYKISVISGDSDKDEPFLRELLGEKAILKFQQQPEDKLKYIKSVQDEGDHVMFMGDGLNDAGALKQSNVGIAIAENSNNFTPASDAILEAGSFNRMPVFIKMSKANKVIIIITFIVSVVYNVIGIYFALKGVLSPMIAAILMPSSSLSILLLTYGASNLLAKKWKL